MRPKKVRRIFWLLILAAAAIGFAELELDSQKMPCVGVALLLAAVAFHFIFYRCPFCGGFLDRSTGNYCPHCGKDLRT